MPERFVLKKTVDFEDEFELDAEKLRAPFSKISNSAFACAKLQATKEGNMFKAKKDIVHSIRYLLLGLQIIQQGSITDYLCSVKYYQKVMDDKVEDWEALQKNYKPLILSLSQQFRDCFPPKQITENRRQRRSRKNRQTKGKLMYAHLGELTSLLSTEIVVNILKFLDPASIASASRVCKIWNIAAKKIITSPLSIH